MTPELELLLACARVGRSEAQEKRIRTLLRAGPDWLVFLRDGDHHGLLPIVHRRLQEVPDAELPEKVSEVLRRRYHALARRNLWLSARLTQLIDALEAREVPAVPLKGSVLAMTVYPDLALREFGDLDILVRRDDLDAARTALRESGLEQLEQLSGGQDAAFRSFWYAYRWHDPRTGVPVELHWRLAPRFFPVGVDPDELFGATEGTTIHGRRVQSLRPEELLLALCVHGTKEEPVPWSRLKWVQDLAEIVQARPDLDWDRLLEMARRAGCLRMLFVGLRLTSDLLAAPVPTGVMARVERDPAASSLAGWVRRRVLGDAAPITRLDRLRFELRVRERARDRARTLLRRALFPDTKDLGLVRLPRPLAGLYVPLRLFRMLVAGLLHPWRILWPWKPLEKTPAPL